jgi:hypothetical protein
LVCSRSGAASKLLEDEVDILGCESGSIIGHLDAHLLSVPMSAQLDGGAGRRVLGGILQQIAQYLAHTLGIAPHQRLWRWRHGQMVLSQHPGSEGLCAIEEHSEGDRMELHREVFSLSDCDGRNSIDKAVKLLDLALDRRKHLHLVLR